MQAIVLPHASLRRPIRGTDGPTLEDVLARGALEAGRVVKIARQIAAAMEIPYKFLTQILANLFRDQYRRIQPETGLESGIR